MASSSTTRPLTGQSPVVQPLVAEPAPPPSPGALPGFSEEGRAAHVFRLRLTMVVGSILALLFVRGDWILFGATDRFWWLVGARVVFAGGSLVLWFRLSRPGNFVSLDRVFLVWSFVAAVFAVGFALSRPPGMLATLIFNSQIVLLLCVAHPMRFRKAVVAPAIIAGGSLLILQLRHSTTTDSITQLTLSGVLLIGLVVGPVIADLMRAAEGRLLVSLGREKKLRGELEDALFELTALEGIVSICSHCRSLRDKQGQWQSVEHFLGELARVEFSHGICPPCFEKHYSESLEGET